MKTRKGKPPPSQRALEAAIARQQAGDLPGAIREYRSLLRRQPAHTGVLTNLAIALKNAGQTEEALKTSARATRLPNAPAETWFNHGNLHRSLANSAEAEQSYRRALKLDPKMFQAATRLAALVAAKGHHDEALALHRQSTTAAPGNAIALRAMALFLVEQHHFEEAERACRRLLELDARDSEALNMLGMVLKDTGRSEAAIESWTKAVAINPKYAVAFNNIGVMHRLLHRPQEAIKHLRIALELGPQDTGTAANLAHALLNAGQVSEAESLCRDALQRKPEHADAQLMLGFALVYRGEADEGLTSFREAIRLEPGSNMCISNLLFASQYSDRLDAAQVLALHREYAVQIKPAVEPRTSWANNRDVQRRLRIGYLSADLRRHPVTMFLEPILTHHDRNQFDIYCYSTTVAPDALTARLRPRCTIWRDCSSVENVQLAAQIETDAIDILVDLSGHTALNRVPALRSRPAPVQALYIGYPGTTGLPEVDYLIADRLICPPEHDKFYSEKIARVDGAFWCYQPPESAPPDSGPAPIVNNGYITFGSYNALQKFSPSTFKLWVRVLKAVPDSRLLLKSLSFADEKLQKSLQRRFADAGIAAQRVVPLPPTDPAKFLAEYRHIDVALDPIPYNGGTTSFEALYMGMPLITLAGDRFCSRWDSAC